VRRGEAASEAAPAAVFDAAPQTVAIDEAPQTIEGGRGGDRLQQTALDEFPLEIKRLGLAAGNFF